MMQTIPAGVKSTNCIFKLDTKLSNFTRGYTNFWYFGGRYGRELGTGYILTAVFHWVVPPKTVQAFVRKTPCSLIKDRMIN